MQQSLTRLSISKQSIYASPTASPAQERQEQFLGRKVIGVLVTMPVFDPFSSGQDIFVLAY